MSRIFIDECPGYSVDEEGRIWSTHRSDRLRMKEGKLHEVRGGVGKNGYRTMRMRGVDGRTRTYYVHELVADAFLGERPVWHQEIRHLDGDKLNCAASNLAWGTRSQNQRDSRRHGTAVVGSRSTLARLDEAKVSRILALIRGGLTNKEIAPMYGVTAPTIWAIRKALTWKHVERSAS